MSQTKHRPGDEIEITNQRTGRVDGAVVVREKKQHNIDFDGYVLLPSCPSESLFKLLRLTADSRAALRVFLGLAALMKQETGLVTCSQSILADMLDVDRSAVSKAMKRLLELDVIRCRELFGTRFWVLNPDYAVRGSHKRANKLWRDAAEQSRSKLERSAKLAAGELIEQIQQRIYAGEDEGRVVDEVTGDLDLDVACLVHEHFGMML